MVNNSMLKAKIDLVEKTHEKCSPFKNDNLELDTASIIATPTVSSVERNYTSNNAGYLELSSLPHRCMSDSVEHKPNNNDSDLTRLAILENLLKELTKKQLCYLESCLLTALNATSDSNEGDRLLLKLFESTTKCIDNIDGPSNSYNKIINLFNADNGHSFADCAQSNFLLEDSNITSPVDQILQPRNTSLVFHEYFMRKHLISKKIKKSLSHLDTLQRLKLKFASKFSTIRSTTYRRHADDVSTRVRSYKSENTNTVVTSFTDNRISNQDSVNATKLSHSFNLVNCDCKIECCTHCNSSRSNDEKNLFSNTCCRLVPFDINRKHIIMASLPHQYINLLNTKVNNNSKKAAFQKYNLCKNIHLYKLFDKVIEAIPNGATFKPINRTRKRRSFDQLVWMADYDKSLVETQNGTNNYNLLDASHHDLTNLNDNEKSNANYGYSSQRCRTNRYDYSALFGLSSTDESDNDYDDLISDGYYSVTEDEDNLLFTSTPQGHRRKYFSKINISHNHPSTNSLTNDSTHSKGFSAGKLQSNSAYDCVILPAELMPVVHIEPIVYKEVVTPEWRCVDRDRMNWLKDCYKHKFNTNKSTNVPKTLTIDPLSSTADNKIHQLSSSNAHSIEYNDDDKTDDEHYIQLHTKYEIAEKERLIDKNRNNDREKVGSLVFEVPSEGSKKSARSSNGRFTKMSNLDAKYNAKNSINSDAAATTVVE